MHTYFRAVAIDEWKVHSYVIIPSPMNGENRMLVTDQPFEVQELRKIIDHFRGIYGT